MSSPITPRCVRCNKKMRNDGTAESPKWVCNNPKCVRYVPPTPESESNDDKKTRPMIRWLIYLPFSLLLTVICYITNPIVLLFCDEDGELPSFLHLWQTWDNSCNPSDVTENKQLPSFLLYDWPKHYEETYGTTPELAKVGRKRWFTKCIDNHFTLWERIKRYICRCYWLTRNCCYGWAFWVLGLNATPFLTIKHSENTCRVKDQKSDAWSYKNTAPIFSIFGWTLCWNNFIGWKIATEAEVDTRAMIANRMIAFSIRREGE